MTLREIIEKADGIAILDYEVVVHMADEPADEVVAVQVVHEAKSIYLEYE